jgi:hypothetical protein
MRDQWLLLDNMGQRIVNAFLPAKGLEPTYAFGAVDPLMLLARWIEYPPVVQPAEGDQKTALAYATARQEHAERPMWTLVACRDVANAQGRAVLVQRTLKISGTLVDLGTPSFVAILQSPRHLYEACSKNGQWAMLDAAPSFLAAALHWESDRR